MRIPVINNHKPVYRLLTVKGALYVIPRRVWVFGAVPASALWGDGVAGVLGLSQIVLGGRPHTPARSTWTVLCGTF